MKAVAFMVTDRLGQQVPFGSCAAPAECFPLRQSQGQTEVRTSGEPGTTLSGRGTARTHGTRLRRHRICQRVFAVLQILGSEPSGYSAVMGAGTAPVPAETVAAVATNRRGSGRDAS